MNWNRARTYLDSIAVRGIRPGLSNMRSLMRRLGHPERRFRAVHVTGTNGKGSVCAMLESVLRQAGLRTGFYSSPHLVDLCERITVSGLRISRAAFAGWVGNIRAAAGSLEPRLTYFEFVTAVAFCHFAERRVQLAVVEVGLGGRLDATNVIPPPEAAVITNIGLEHQHYLGDTLPRIAREKAGILKPGTACVTAASGSALRVIARAARRLEAPLLRADAGSRIAGISLDEAIALSSLKGRFQRDNLRAVLRVVEVLRERHWPVLKRALAEGLRRTRWPGRFQRLKLAAGSRGVPVILDGAHNPAAVRGLVRALRGEGLQRRPADLVFNALRDKNVPEMARLLSRSLKISRVWVPALRSERGSDPEKVAGLFRRRLGRKRARALPSVRAAWAQARRSGERPAWVLATGSLYLVGETLNEI